MGFLLQGEAFPQICQLPVCLSCLVLHPLLVQLDTELRQRAASRVDSVNTGDDGMDSVTDIFAILDDISATVPYDDHLIFFQRFAELGAPVGCRLAPNKL
ncbi:MAG: hypothetical protein ACREOZ_03720 [Gloeomargaritales cyanobacterium]